MYVDILLKDENMVSFSQFMDIDLKQNTSDNNEILLGNASAASLNFSIWNGEKQYNTFKFKGSTAYLYRDAGRTKKLGVFNVDKITKDKNSLKFECTDYMTKLDEPFKGVQTPFTLWGLLNQIALQLEIPLRNTEEDFAHLPQQYNDTNDILGKKCREIIRYIGELACKYAIMDEDGQLYFDWYDLDNDDIKEIPYSSLKSFARDEEELHITKVSAIIDNEEMVEGLEEGYDLRLSADNPFLKPLSFAARTSILQNIHSKVYGMHYLSCDISIATDEDIKAGDTLKIYDEDGIDYKILVTYLNINKIFSTKITSAGENVNRDNQSSSSVSSSSTQDRTYISKDENWRDININTFAGETFLNSISIFGVNEKSSALLTYILEFESDIESLILFKFYINDILTKEIEFYVREGMNLFTWSEAPNIRFADETNTFKFTLDTTSLINTPFKINIKKEKSILSVVSIGARAGSNAITHIEFKEDVKLLTLTNVYDELIIKDLSDELIIDVRDWINGGVTDSINLINFVDRPRMTILNINEIVDKEVQ